MRKRRFRFEYEVKFKGGGEIIGKNKIVKRFKKLLIVDVLRWRVNMS